MTTMNSSTQNPAYPCVIVEQEVQFTLEELSRACGTDSAQLILLVDEGILDPGGQNPRDWVFSGLSLRRARTALRMARDLQLGVEGAALVLDLLDEIEGLRSQLRRVGLTQPSWVGFEREL
jgi:chaperone modulatory protein CbpM